ncbi:DUF2797 domain-containing protein [Hazenella coriacea]|uniref:Uncharacterized protein DUF2797 n=1 Tax=Hazenella coriacea TaxID=1179467 RepID=A0A4R3LC63_9BACL|nr:DUF2797 domain-containing protein [Hazenella coriacea]TCS95914.1 uncharacterized protein DUF2797 [Hazenella coriacea]
MKKTGFLHSLHHQFSDPIDYHAQIGDEQFLINPFIGERIQLSFLGEISCIHCGRRIKKTYNSGYCYPCFKSLAENDLCIVKPHLCHFHQGTCRDPEFGERFCMQPHIVYLALSSDVKVGITRKTNLPKRWIDQGATAAVPILEVPTRKLAGEVEVYLAQYMKDKTNWRKMLRNEVADQDLTQVRDEVLARLPDHYQPFVLEPRPISYFQYPHIEVPEKISSLKLDKHPEVHGRLIGVKAQYLILDSGVFHVRNHSGYKIAFSV